MTLLQLDPSTFAQGRSRAPRAVRHALRRHDLLGLDALADLAGSLPERSVEHNVGALPAVLPDGDAPRADLTPAEIVRGIDTNGCWMVLKNVEQSPAYRRLLDECLDEIEPLAARGEGASVLREGFVFLSAPGSVTPVHIDHEHNVLLQVRGTKTMTIGDFGSAAEQQEEAERLHAGGHRNLACPPTREQAFPLEPGDGVYVPPYAPHWVQNGDGVSVSLSVTWRTAALRREADVHMVNARLRRLGLAPGRPGAVPARDRAKSSALRGWTALGSLRRSGSPT